MTMIQHRDPGDESEAAMTDERAAVELKGCLSCGGKVIRDFVTTDVYDVIACTECDATFDWTDEDWNTRPIEDALRAENERLKAENTSLKEANEIDLGEKAPLIFENTELSARVSELTRLLAEAEGAIQAYFEGEHHPLIEGVNRLIEDANSYSDATIEWKVRAINAERDLEEAEEALREALSPPARRTSYEWTHNGEVFAVEWGRLFRGLTNEVEYEGWIMKIRSPAGSWMKQGGDFNSTSAAIATLANLTPPEEDEHG